MIQLFPKRKKIYIVCDHTLSCVNEYNELKRLFPKYRDIKFETLWSDNYTAPEFAKKLSSLDKDSPLLYEAAYTNKKELSIRTLDEGVKFVNTYFHGPVFSASSYGVKAGALGGEVISFYQHGRVIGRMVKRVLEGADISKMKVMPIPPYEYMFNYNTMKKFGISECQLPSGSVILNKPKSIYEQHKDVVITTIVFISLLLVMIVFLVRLLLQRVKTSKELVIAKDRAEQSDRLKSDFIRNMSHEVKTPLNSIVGFTDLLASGCEKNAENNSYIAIIHDNVKQLIGIIRKVLEIASIESRAEELVMSEISLTDILNDQYHNNVDAACAKGLELIFDHTNDASDCVILSDGKKLSKMLSYLLENAIKFTSKGDIHIGFRHEKNAKRVLIYVKDTGIGISADQQKIIFGRFMQTEDPLSRKFGGMGLGLAIARENAHLLGGDISVESEIGEGATFFVSLPC
jgi:signal transduction histidine kinase